MKTRETPQKYLDTRRERVCLVRRRRRKSKSAKHPLGLREAARSACRYAAIWACQSSADCSRRMAASCASPANNPA